ncbi:MAG TPA: endo-1,4-beta-xylanase [Phycisphaerae bacterium]|nr:endo-1,4-beta-xylanase [Phycisphaerae bacterium]
MDSAGERRGIWAWVGMLLMAAMAWMAGGCAAFDRDAWKRTADADIARYRQRDANVSLVDAAGMPLAGVRLTIRQRAKSFPFGSAISGGFLRNAKWQEEFKEHFNWAVFENETKWYSNEPAQGRVNYRQADALAAWCEANGVKVRGHCIYWAVDKWQQAWLAALDAEDLRAAVERRMEVVTHFAGRVQSWDVDNEMLHGSFFADRLGAGIRPWMFERAHALDSGVQLFTNDYNILSVDQSFKRVQTQAYAEQIRGLLKQGAPITGIGVQGHLWTEDILKHPEVIRQRLDLLAKLGLPIWITEFDVADADPRVRADKLELIYRTAYSDPAVQGIMMWVFWAGNSWRGANAALFDQDWNINEEGRRFESLMKEWSTSVSVTTGSDGRCAFRGFHGTYHVERADTGAPVGDFELRPGAGAQVIRLVQPS